MSKLGTNNESNRQKWLRAELAAIPAGQHILDAGAGELRNKPLCSHLKYVSQDYCQYDGKGDGISLQTGNWDTSNIDVVCDIADMPIPDASFDAVLCSEVFEHLPNPEKAISELVRVLKPGGTLLLTAPFCSLTHFAPYHYSSGFNIYWYRHHLQRLGCEILAEEANGNWFEYIAQELRRLPRMGWNYSSKGAGLITRLLSIPVLWGLQILAWRDRGSSELLNYGWHIKARKIQ